MQRELLRAELDLQRLYQELLPAVYRVAYTYMKNSFDSEDAAQEAFYRLARYRGSFHDERAVKGWLIVTVSNVCKDMLRRRHREDEGLEEHPELLAPGMTDDTLLALMELPGKFKAALYLYYYEGYGVREIARLSGKSEGTVKSWLARARALLKRRLEEVP